MDRPKRKSKKTKPVIGKPTELTGDALRAAILRDKELLERTEKARAAFEAGRFSTLEEVKQRLGDV